MVRRAIVRAAVCTTMCFALASCGWLPALQRSVASPEVRAPLPEPGRAAFYVAVERGQTIDQIAKTYRVAERDIVVANHLRSPYKLRVGVLLEVPLASHHIATKAGRPWGAKTAIHQTPTERTQYAARHPKPIPLD